MVITSAVDWLMSKFGTNFARNSKLHMRMTILCQLRDSVTPAIENHNRATALERSVKNYLGASTSFTCTTSPSVSEVVKHLVGCLEAIIRTEHY